LSVLLDLQHADRCRLLAHLRHGRGREVDVADRRRDDEDREQGHAGEAGERTGTHGVLLAAELVIRSRAARATNPRSRHSNRRAAATALAIKPRPSVLSQKFVSGYLYSRDRVAVLVLEPTRASWPEADPAGPVRRRAEQAGLLGQPPDQRPAPGPA